jgi:erythronate-4-phosphate dehydrogenase
MKIVIDEKIPFIRGAFEPWAEVFYYPGSAIDKNIVKDADAIIVRTRTKCNSRLLEESSVKIVASATIGFDHIDTSWLEAKGIKWVNAPGCNSGSVMQYIMAALFFLAAKHSLDLRSLILGVVGIGNVGSKVVRAARAVGMTVLQNDPPRERREGPAGFVALEKIVAESDILTLHVPLNMEGTDKTYHLFNDRNLSQLSRSCILINSSRGEVVDNTALRNALSAGTLRGAVIDVWEGEPDADRRLIDLADLATPHIAGYSVDGKANATIAVVREVSSALGIPLTAWQPGKLPEADEPLIDISGHTHGNSALEKVAHAVHHTYPVNEDDLLFRSDPGKFEFIRDNYRTRREFSSYTVNTDDTGTATILSGLGFNITQ